MARLLDRCCPCNPAAYSLYGETWRLPPDHRQMLAKMPTPGLGQMLCLINNSSWLLLLTPHVACNATDISDWRLAQSHHAFDQYKFLAACEGVVFGFKTLEDTKNAKV